MPGYQSWARDLLKTGVLPTSWMTWQGPTKASAGPSTPWLYKRGETITPKFTINDTGLAQEILKVDPNATVLAFSWIDESATPAVFFHLFPTKGYRSEAFTTMAGMQMAEAVTEALAPNYSTGLGKVHLIGHSHGARVASVAAVALQQAAAINRKFNVLGQLTLLDSPEYGTKDAAESPEAIDAANYDWFYLSQLKNIAQPGSPVSLVGSGQNTVSPIFVDSYVSYFGQDYGNFVVNDPSQGIDNQSLANVVDVNLDPSEAFHLNPRDIGLKHEYAANWYAGSATTKGAGNPVGLMWSPLIKGSSVAPLRSKQTWTPPGSSETQVGSATQFVLKTQPRAATIEPKFDPVELSNGSEEGNATITQAPANANKVTAVTLNDDNGKDASFRGTIDDHGSAEGFSFTYSFTRGSTDGAQVQILVDGYVLFVMTGSVAESSVLPGSSQFSSTFGLENLPSIARRPLPGDIASNIASIGGGPDIQIRLVPSPDGGDNGAGTPTTVKLSNFEIFRNVR